MEVRTDDRRRHHRVRAVFEEAFERCRPLLDPHQGIAGQALTHHIPLRVREHFPDLTQEEVLVLSIALRAAWTRRRLRG
jgi:phage terminase Nu1 subunit (DNA packaging protein)